jgi:hypothetical protein
MFPNEYSNDGEMIWYHNHRDEINLPALSTYQTFEFLDICMAHGYITE